MEGEYTLLRTVKNSTVFSARKEPAIVGSAELSETFKQGTWKKFLPKEVKVTQYNEKFRLI